MDGRRRESRKARRPDTDLIMKAKKMRLGGSLVLLFLGTSTRDDAKPSEEGAKLVTNKYNLTFFWFNSFYKTA